MFFFQVQTVDICILFLVKEICVEAINNPIRIEGYARKVFKDELPTNKSIKKAVKKGTIRINNSKIPSSHWMKNGELIQLWDLEELPPKPFDIDLEIVFEDHFFAVINKPAGICVSGNQFRTIQNGVVSLLQKTNETDALNWPKPVHRLDKATSGLLVIAKTRSAMSDLGMQFEARTIKKSYHAIVHGSTPSSGTLDASIKGQSAVTRYDKILEVPSLRNNTITLLKLAPETGRTHQIRLHCSQIGNPILGDQLYAAKTKTNKGLFLAATGIQFKHPKSQKTVSFSIPFPNKFKAQLDREQRRWTKYNTPE
ncbi:RluA family pseudouridine synthase [Flavobacteriales bacterium]|nr:RluA family pseudouridine synthase [Flavobacteriales bacterium]